MEPTEKVLQKLCSKQFTDRETLYCRNKKIYTNWSGDGTLILFKKIKSVDDYAVIKRKGDPIKLLLYVLKLIFNQESELYSYASMHKGVIKVHSYRQSNQSWPEYKETIIDNLKLVQDTSSNISPKTKPGKNDNFLVIMELRNLGIDPMEATDTQ